MLHSFLQIVRERKKKTKCQRKYQRVKEGEICEHSRTFTVDWKRFRFENVTDLLWGGYYEIKQHLSKRLKKTSKVSVCNNHYSTSWWKLLYVFPIDVTRNDHFKQETRKKNEKLGVDPPPSPTTPASYRQLFCNLRRVHPYGKTTSFKTHACF